MHNQTDIFRMKSIDIFERRDGIDLLHKGGVQENAGMIEEAIKSYEKGLELAKED